MPYQGEPYLFRDGGPDSVAGSASRWSAALHCLLGCLQRRWQFVAEKHRKSVSHLIIKTNHREFVTTPLLRSRYNIRLWFQR